MANSIIFIYKAIDKYTAVGRSIKSVTNAMRVSFDSAARATKRFNVDLKKIGETLKKTGRKIKDIGRGITTYISAPAAAFSALSIRNFDRQAKAMAKVENAIKSTGGVAKLTFSELRREATRLQNNTLFGDEDILNKATAQLLTFTNIAGKEFLRTQEIALDLATMLDGDLQSSSIMLGKALNDPVANLSALGRAGIQFSESQKEVVKVLFKSGRVAEAQNIILKELERQYGGTAKAAALAGTGPLTQLTNSIGDLSEAIGKEQFSILKPMIDGLKNITHRFQNSSPSVKKMVAVVLLLLTALGPLVLILGQLSIAFGVMSIAASLAGTTIWAAMAPILLIIAAIGLLITAGVMLYTRWDDVVGGAKMLWQDLSSFVVKVAVGIKNVITGLFDAVVLSVSDAMTRVHEKVMGLWNKLVGLKNKVMGFFVGSDDIKADLTKRISVQSNSHSTLDVNLNTAKNVTAETKASQRGSPMNMNIGLNNAFGAS